MTEVHPRVHERHPGLTGEDVKHVWENCEVTAVRTEGVVEIRLGFDSRGRCLEMIGALRKNGWLVYHAFTPPTKKFMQEIRRNTRWS